MTKNGKKQGGIILKKYNKIIGLLLAVALMLPGMATKVSAAENDTMRLEGLDRIETSIAVSKEAYKTGAKAVVLAGWNGSADALTGTLLANAKNAPLLLTKAGVLDAKLIVELDRLNPEMIYVIGGETVVSKDVENLLKENYNVKRVAGATRFETSAEIAKETGKDTKHVFLANGLGDLADALAVGPASAKENMPIMLTDAKFIPTRTLNAMNDLKVTDVTIIGGKSVVSDAVVTQLTDLGIKVKERIAGEDRYETATAIAARYFVGSTKAIVANGFDSPDALVAGYLAALNNAPVLLSNVSTIKAPSTDYLKAGIDFAYIIGGPKAINDDVEKLVVQAVKSDELMIDSVNVIGTKTVKVTFNRTVDTTKAVLNIKKGAAIYGSTVAWNEAKTEATLTAVVNLPAADYMLEVTGLTDVALTKAFSVATEVASKIEVVNTTVALENSAKVSFKVLNQYGEDMKINGTVSGVVVTAYNTTQKRVETLTNVTADNKLTFAADFKTNTNPAKLGDVIRVTVAYAGLTTQSNVTVVDPAASATIAFGTIAPLKDKVRISVSEAGLVVPYTMFDQFGEKTKLDTHTANQDTFSDVETISGVKFISSNPLIVDVDTFAVDSDGKLTFATGAKDGTAVITAIINTSGEVATFTVQVNNVAIVDGLVISAPTALVAAGETVKLGLSAVDQFGANIAAKDIANVVITSSNTAVVADGSTIAAGKLNVATIAAGTTVLTAKVGTKVVGTVTVVVEAGAIASLVKSVSFAPKFEIGAVKTLTTDDFIVVDQYGRTIDKSKISFTVAEKTVADTNFNLATNEFTAAVAGSSVMVLKATYITNNSMAADKEFTLTVIPSTDITNYAITAVPTMYSGVSHARKLELVGKTSANETVALKANKVTHATSSDTSKVAVAVASGIATVTGVDAAEGTSIVSLWNGGTKLAETTVTLSKVKPVITTVKFNDTVETVLDNNVNLLDNLEVKDQYGIKISGNGFWTSSNTAKATVTNGTVTVVAADAGDAVTIGYVTENGLVASAVLTK